jgi:tripartite-type tricarboxylate transporter receptor subunit TctC
MFDMLRTRLTSNVRGYSIRRAAALQILLLNAWAIESKAVETFPANTLTIVVGSDVGGGYDALGRLTSRHIGRLLPGEPAVVVKAMPGGSGLIAANYLFNIARAEEAEIGLVMRNVLTAQLLNPENSRFDVKKFNWIGSLASESGVAIVWKKEPQAKAPDPFINEIIVGATTGTDTEITARLLNELIGTKFKIVTGYKGNADILAALERGEVQGMANVSWSNIRRHRYMRDGQIDVLLQNALNKEADLKTVPLSIDFAKNDVDRKVMALFLGQRLVARPLVAPPKMPSAQVDAVRSAFMRLATDKQFLEDAAKSQIPVEITSHKELNEVIDAIANAPPDVVSRFADISRSRK